MIKRIKTIKNLGIYRDFRWDKSLPEFAKLNLIYGWNYSGKTTLSRIFQMLEYKKVDSEYPGVSFEVELEDGSQISSKDLSIGPVVRVFNHDYVRKNFKQEYSAPSVFIVGEESIGLRKRLEQFTKRLDRVNNMVANYASRQQTIKSEIDRLGTDKARDVRHLLGDPNLIVLNYFNGLKRLNMILLLTF